MTIKRDDLPHLDFGDAVTGEMLPAAHPGDILLYEFMAPNDLSANALAIALRIPVARVAAIARGRQAISPETALRLARYFGTFAEFWASLQTRYALRLARAAAAAAIEREIQPLGA